MMNQPVLIVGSTGKTGRRVSEKLLQEGIPVRSGSRSAEQPFDWSDSSTWEPVLQGTRAAYITYYPDLAVPGAAQAIDSFARLAVEIGVRRLVLLSGRGEEEAQRSELALQNSGADWTILRCSWFCQNFSESFLYDMVKAGVVALPAGSVKEPFIDADDIAAAAVSTLTDDRHIGQLYELTGPQAITFAEATSLIAQACQRNIRYLQLTSEQFISMLSQQQVPGESITLLSYLFSSVLDGRNEIPADGVEQILGRKPRTFFDYARQAARAGVWD
ncbi:SDR family oxidoreductase [Paenibacillus sp. XY044]|uniref:SDR family oxidoreductase n=1 Tax=Paenibacillus sp. XY044 TaxID=2026089 RepID=UPI000B9891EF|nr:NAD(P)H-binding protein [Paenibacillus sp. XY044]OZB95319.1 NmrA family transcriptional regulator [Paenibacillus sp. XY044]